MAKWITVKNKCKACIWYVLEALAIGGLALPIGLLSTHLQNFGNRLLSPEVSWQHKFESASEYWNVSWIGIVFLTVVFVVAFGLFLAVRRRSDRILLEAFKDLAEDMPDMIAQAFIKVLNENNLVISKRSGQVNETETTTKESKATKKNGGKTKDN